MAFGVRGQPVVALGLKCRLRHLHHSENSRRDDANQFHDRGSVYRRGSWMIFFHPHASERREDEDSRIAKNALQEVKKAPEINRLTMVVGVDWTDFLRI